MEHEVIHQECRFLGEILEAAHNETKNDSGIEFRMLKKDTLYLRDHKGVIE